MELNSQSENITYTIGWKTLPDETKMEGDKNDDKEITGLSTAATPGSYGSTSVPDKSLDTRFVLFSVSCN